MAYLTPEQRKEVIENGGQLGMVEHNVGWLLDHGFEPIVEMYVNDGDEDGMNELQTDLEKLLGKYGIDEDMIEVPFPG